MSPLLAWAGKRPLTTALAGAVLLLLSFPPVGWWPLAWVATIPWIALVATPDFEASHPWKKIWLASVVYWAAATYYVSIPHPLLWFGWVALFLFLSIYPLLFVWIGRKLVHGHRVPMLIAAPLVFTALEWVRAHALSGFGLTMLANSQYRVPLILQVSDIAGGYGLTFLMVLFAAGCFLLISRQRQIAGVVTCLVTLGIVVGYGMVQLQHFATASGEPIDMAVIQGNIDTRFPDTEQELAEYRRQRMEDYLRIHQEWYDASIRSNPPDLIIWPEGKYPVPEILPGGTSDENDAIRQAFRDFHEWLFGLDPDPPALVAGTATRDPVKDEFFNSAVLIGTRGQVSQRYLKQHLVIFGEYIPGQQWFPALGRMTPIGEGFASGDFGESFKIGPYYAMPFICFESAVAHLIRESVGQLRSLNKDPDFLINLTDDGWFYGTAVLDHHLACNVMRAVENRKPVIAAANTGLSAIIQSTGEILHQGPRRKEQVMRHTVELKPRTSPYAYIGDWPAIIMTVICVFAIVLPPRRAPGTQTND